ncbi:MAG TPA: UvrD-helicase domain-containing protein [Anaerolineaceae bacterium]|nr:UvrD-helicase domain-containing protein [Anaerolineaceae bacterium]
MNDIFSDLNPQQKAAVSAPDGQTLVLAGPGSGKTRVLTQRAAFLILEREVDPFRILAVTFTNKAAREMQERLQRSLGGKADGLWLGTFHSICARILRREADALPFTRDFVIMDADDQQNLVKLSLKELNIDDKLYPPASLHAAISNAKNNLIQPKDFAASSYREEVIRRVFEQYEQKLQASNALDFDDLLLYAVRLLQENDAVREKYARRFYHVLVDEFQDTNMAQYELLQLLASHYQNIFVVGDEDQSIYRWRGADYRNVLRFQKDYPNHTKLLLEQNYRSTQNVLDAASAVIDRNSQRTPKKLFSKRGKGDKIVLYEAIDDHAEAMFAVETIRALVESKKAKGGDIAIMYRTNAQSRLLEEAFFQSRMPYRLVGAQRFYGRQEVKDMIAYLRTVQNPADEVSLLRVINLPPRGIGDKTIKDLRTCAEKAELSMGSVLLDLGSKQDASPFWNAFSPRAASALAAFGALLANWRVLSPTILLPDLFEHILKDTNYQEFITDASSEVGYSRWENVQELLRMAYEYSQVGLVEFLENLALVSDQDTLPEKSDSPTLLTLHAAKGLEFKVVFIIGLDEGTLPHRRSMDDPEEMAEERRLFYVGITRTKDHLYLVRADQRRSFGSFDYSVPSRFLDEIPENLLLRAGLQHYRSKSFSLQSVQPRWTSTSEKPKSAPKESAQYSAGMHVKHAVLGNGIVIQSKLQGDDEVVTVAFDKAGLKKLSAAIAKLEIL